MNSLLAITALFAEKDNFKVKKDHFFGVTHRYELLAYIANLAYLSKYGESLLADTLLLVEVKVKSCPGFFPCGSVNATMHFPQFRLCGTNYYDKPTPYFGDEHVSEETNEETYETFKAITEKITYTLQVRKLVSEVWKKYKSLGIRSLMQLLYFSPESPIYIGDASTKPSEIANEEKMLGNGAYSKPLPPKGKINTLETIEERREYEKLYGEKLLVEPIAELVNDVLPNFLVSLASENNIELIKTIINHDFEYVLDENYNEPVDLNNEYNGGISLLETMVSQGALFGATETIETLLTEFNKDNKFSIWDFAKGTAKVNFEFAGKRYKTEDRKEKTKETLELLKRLEKESIPSADTYIDNRVRLN